MMIFGNRNLDAMIKSYEDPARKALKRKDLSDRHIMDIETMLFRFDEVRKAVKRNDAATAAYNMGLAMQAAMRAEIRPIEKPIRTGVKVLNNLNLAIDAHTGSAEDRYIEWQTKADEIWRKFPSYTKRHVAMKICDEQAEDAAFRAKWRTIYYVIQRPHVK
jgi:hypothetical protein